MEAWPGGRARSPRPRSAVPSRRATSDLFTLFKRPDRSVESRPAAHTIERSRSVSPAARTRMTPIESLAQPAFLREIHRLLWTPKFDGRDGPDYGWSCYDHAVVVALLLTLWGVGCEVVHGQCMFVEGESENGPPIGMGQDAGTRAWHIWLEVSPHLIVDLSPNLAPDPPPVHWRNLDFYGVACGELRPRGIGRLVRCSTEQGYRQEIALASHSTGGLVAIYREERRASFHVAQAVQRVLVAGGYYRLQGVEGVRAYAAAVLHLEDFINGAAKAVGGVQPKKAWDVVLSRYANPADELERRLASVRTPNPPNTQRRHP